MKFSNESIEAMARGGEAAAVVSLMDSLFDDIFSPSISIDFPPQFRTDFVSGMFVADADANLGTDSANSQGAASSRKRGENSGGISVQRRCIILTKARRDFPQLDIKWFAPLVNSFSQLERGVLALTMTRRHPSTTAHSSL